MKQDVTHIYIYILYISAYVFAFVVVRCANAYPRIYYIYP